jgi:hypothetical protein
VETERAFRYTMASDDGLGRLVAERELDVVASTRSPIVVRATGYDTRANEDVPAIYAEATLSGTRSPQAIALLEGVIALASLHMKETPVAKVKTAVRDLFAYVLERAVGILALVTALEVLCIGRIATAPFFLDVGSLVMLLLPRLVEILSAATAHVSQYMKETYEVPLPNVKGSMYGTCFQANPLFAAATAPAVRYIVAG